MIHIPKNMSNEITEKITDELKQLSIAATGKENIDQGERALSVVAGTYVRLD